MYCLYVSPLKSLANDIHRNLTEPLSGIADIAEGRGETVDIRHAIRHGDTSSADRQKMLSETPHILNTTPETLAILLNSPKFKEKLRTVEYVVVDEIHSLAENKRGTHLSVSLERLEDLAEDRRRASAVRRPSNRSTRSRSSSSAARSPAASPATTNSWTRGSSATSTCDWSVRQTT